MDYLLPKQLTNFYSVDGSTPRIVQPSQPSQPSQSQVPTLNKSKTPEKLPTAGAGESGAGESSSRTTLLALLAAKTSVGAKDPFRKLAGIASGFGRYPDNLSATV